MLNLNLNGICHSAQILNFDLTMIAKDREEYSCFHDLYAKVSAPIQIILVLVDTVVTQTLRGLCLVVGGSLTRNWEVFSEGIRDFASVAVQIVALPIIAVISLVHTQKAYNIANKLFLRERGKDHEDFAISEFDFAISEFDFALSKFKFDADKTSVYVPAILMQLLGVPLSSFRYLTRASIDLLSGRIEAIVLVFMAVYIPFSVIASIFPCSGTKSERMDRALQLYRWDILR